MLRLIELLIQLSVRLAAIGILAIVLILIYLDAALPNAAEIREVKLQMPLKIYSAEDKLLAEFGEMRRTPIAFKDLPPLLVKAFLATEDARFYQHSGVDFKSLGRAMVALVSTGSKSQGGSTITMQVARNYFLTRQKTYLRKLNEILLAWRIEKEFTKDEILELYLNKIYFGKRAYGIAAAAEVYYGKSVNELTLAQMAMLAGLPQAPSFINPINNKEAAMRRRTHVLDRMLHYGYITPNAYYEAQKAPIAEAAYHVTTRDTDADYVAEMVRMALFSQFGEALYTSGFSVKTTLRSELQHGAVKSLQAGLLAYDKRHGYRGPVKTLNKEMLEPRSKIMEALSEIPTYGPLQLACLLNPASGFAILADGQEIIIDPKSTLWPQKRPLSVGDVVYVERTSDVNEPTFILSQIPQAASALVALDPNNGQILALVGGFDFNLSKFNRVTQALRQPGSSFKPFIYAAALDAGFSPASIINDAPVILENIDPNNEWRPQNSTHEFYGPTRLREALVQSRNLVSIRLLQAVGMRQALRFLERFGFQKENLVPNLSLALGTNIVTPLELTTAYAVLANGGYRILPYIIQEVRDGTGKVVLKTAEQTLCDTCPPPAPSFKSKADEEPVLTLRNENEIGMPVVSPQVVYLMNNMLQDVIKEGTGRKALSLGRHDLAGKTGTTNNQMDAWFAGFNADIVTTTWVGFDEPKSLNEYGAEAALPIWIDFMRMALHNKKERSMSEPPGIITEKIDPETGLLATKTQDNARLEYFIRGTEPTNTASVNESWSPKTETPRTEELF